MKKEEIILSRTDYGHKTFDSSRIYDLTPEFVMPWWVIVIILLTFTGLMIISPLPFKVIALFFLIIIFTSL